MPTGADKGFTFDPPGAIGIVAPDARVLLRFHDDEDIRPKDVAGALNDLAAPVGAVNPESVIAACGAGREFTVAGTNALAATDLATGSSLITRDVTVQAILSWDILGQGVAGTAGALVARGLSTSAAEYIAYELQLAVVNPATRRGSIAWSWQTIAGVVKAQTPVEFTCPTGFTLLTATRRWESPTSVVCRYYIGDVLLGEVASSDGDIGGGASGTFILGADKVGGALGRWFAGTLDELAVFDRELCLEEIEDTWLRITVYQPLGVQLFREMHDPGFPMSTDPASDVQLENRQIGMALGYAAAAAENLRRNALPQRSYGDFLAAWEQALRPTTQPGRSLDDRRARVLARMRQRGGSAPPELQEALSSLLGGASVDDLQFLAFDNTVSEDFQAGLDLIRWDVSPAATVSVVLGVLNMQIGVTTALFPSGWLYLRRSVGGNARQAHQIAKLTFTSSTNGSEAGIFFGDAGLGNYFLMGLRNTGAANYHVFVETFIHNISQGGAVDQGDSGVPLAAVVPIWLYLHQADTFWEVSWSLTSGTAGFGPPLMVASVPPAMQWAGMYMRTTGAATGGLLAKFDEHLLRATFGVSPYNAYVLLDRALGFSPDLPGARQIVQTVKHAFVRASFTTRSFLHCDDQADGTDNCPLGGY
jgi:hypothetical protein